MFEGIVGEKQCRICAQCKPLPMFGTSKGKPRGECRACQAEIALAYYHRVKNSKPKRGKPEEGSTAWMHPSAHKPAIRAAALIQQREWKGPVTPGQLRWVA